MDKEQSIAFIRPKAWSLANRIVERVRKEKYPGHLQMTRDRYSWDVAGKKFRQSILMVLGEPDSSTRDDLLHKQEVQQ